MDFIFRPTAAILNVIWEQFSNFSSVRIIPAAGSKTDRKQRTQRSPKATEENNATRRSWNHVDQSFVLHFFLIFSSYFFFHIIFYSNSLWAPDLSGDFAWKIWCEMGRFLFFRKNQLIRLQTDEQNEKCWVDVCQSWHERNRLWQNASGCAPQLCVIIDSFLMLSKMFRVSKEIGIIFFYYSAKAKATGNIIFLWVIRLFWGFGRITWALIYE